ncbi:hypothetical protein SUDANB120_06216 (plasmid) [Streptomyces sp. enrichment culture]
MPSVCRNLRQLTAAGSPLASMSRIRFSQASKRASTVPKGIGYFPAVTADLGEQPLASSTKPYPDVTTALAAWLETAAAVKGGTA